MIGLLLTWTYVALIITATSLVAYSGLLFFAGMFFKSKHRESHEEPSISIILAAKNEEKRIGCLLSQLTNQNYPEEKYEVIVSEDGSTDSTRKIASDWASKFPDLIKVVSSEKSSGKPTALNRAFAASRGEIIGELDADSSVDRELLRHVASKFENVVVAVQGETSIRNKYHGLIAKLTSFEHEVWNRMLLRGRARLGLFVPSLGNLTFIRRSVLSEVGGWDQGALAEDVELSIAMWLKGYKFEYHPEVKCDEVTVSKVKSFYTQRMRWYGGYIQSLFRHGNLLKHLSAGSIDGELLLAAPLAGVLGVCILFLGLLAIAAHINTSQIIAWAPYTVGAYTIFSSVAVFSAFKFEGQSHNWMLIPAIYVYWGLNAFISSIAFLKILTRRKMSWIRTEK